MKDGIERMDEVPEQAVNTSRRQWTVIFVLAAIAVAAFFGLCLVFARDGADFIARRDNSVGDMLMREGKRQEASSMFAEALETYERALKATFNGPENRTYTLEHAGMILWKEGRYEEAVAYFLQARNGPGATSAPYEGLVDSLIVLKRLDEAQSFLDAWESRPDAAADQGKICYASGELAEARGDMNQALEIYRKCAEKPDGALSLGRLGELMAKQGDREAALSQLERYFLLGAPGRNNDALRTLYYQLTNETPVQ